MAAGYEKGTPPRCLRAVAKCSHGFVGRGVNVVRFVLGDCPGRHVDNRATSRSRPEVEFSSARRVRRSRRADDGVARQHWAFLMLNTHATILNSCLVHAKSDPAIQQNHMIWRWQGCQKYAGGKPD
jgi:hypothetical protein